MNLAFSLHASLAPALAVLCAFFAVLASCAAEVTPKNSGDRKFVHPGIFYTQGDFDRMKAMVAAGKEPWKRTFEALKASRYSNPNVWARPRGGEIAEGKFNQTIGFDGRHAHDLALLWKVTGEEAYAAKARDFLVANSHWTGASWGGTGPLDNGKIYLLVEAAEMMRDYAGWAEEDRKRFGEMLRKVFVPHIYGGDIMRWGNQGLTAWHGLLAIAVFLDDVKMYDRVWNNLAGLPHRPDDHPFASGGVWKPDWPANYGPFFIERTKPPAFGNEPDWGYDDQVRYYIYANGQCEESCRDQAHAMYGIGQLVAIAETFWSQGDDLYGLLDNRILLGLEWSLRYNLSDWEPKGFTEKESEATFENGLFLRTRTRNNRWTSVNVSNHARGADGGPAAPRTAALMHYAYRRGVDAEKTAWLLKAVKRSLANNGCETWGAPPSWFYEWEGWGTLTKMRTRHQGGDPGTWRDGERVSGAHKVPGRIRAADFDFLPPGPKGSRKCAYYPGTSKVPRSAYRTDAVVPLVKSGKAWGLGKLRKGERCDYTLSVGETAKRKVSLWYRNTGDLTVSLSVDGGKAVTRKLPETQKIAKADAGTLQIEAGAPVLRLAIDSATAAEIYAIEIE